LMEVDVEKVLRCVREKGWLLIVDSAKLDAVTCETRYALARYDDRWEAERSVTCGPPEELVKRMVPPYPRWEWERRIMREEGMRRWLEEKLPELSEESIVEALRRAKCIRP